MPSFGENLRNLRKSRGYSQERFAREIDSTQAAITAWECGTRLPNIPTIKHIAETFHVPLSSLISIEETGLEDDYVREVSDLLKNNPVLRELIDKAKYLDNNKLSILISVVNAFSGENDK